MRRLLPALPAGPICTALPTDELPTFPPDRGPSSRNIDAFRPTPQVLTIPHAGHHKPAEHPISFPPPAISRFRLGQQRFFLSFGLSFSQAGMVANQLPPHSTTPTAAAPRRSL